MSKLFLSAAKLAVKLNPIIAVVTTTISVVEVGKKVYDFFNDDPR